jgi:monoterpene epsilon-lactone hydrolase
MMLYYKVMRSVRSRMDMGPVKLRGYLEKLAILNPPPNGTKTTIHSIGEINCEEIRLKTTDENRAVLFIHGGAFAFGSSRTHRNMLANISKLTGQPVFSIDYRLSPEHQYPIALNDCLNAFTWLSEKYGAENIVIAGDSAGGNLTGALIHLLKQKELAVPKGICLLSAWLDLRGESESARLNHKNDSVFDRKDLLDYAKMYCTPEEMKSALVSPLLGDLSGFPPTLIQVAKNELLFSDSDLFAQKLQQANVPVDYAVSEKLFHSWQLYPLYLKEAKQSLAEMADFILSLD